MNDEEKIAVLASRVRGIVCDGPVEFQEQLEIEAEIKVLRNKQRKREEGVK